MEAGQSEGQSLVKSSTLPQCCNTHLLIVWHWTWCHHPRADSSSYGVWKFLLGKHAPRLHFLHLLRRNKQHPLLTVTYLPLSSFWSLRTTVAFWSAASATLWTRRSPLTLAPSPLSSHFSFALWCGVFLSASPRSGRHAAAAKGDWLFRGRSGGLKVRARLPAARGRALDHIQPWL